MFSLSLSLSLHFSLSLSVSLLEVQSVTFQLLKSHEQFLLLSAIRFVFFISKKMVIESPYNPLINIFVYSYLLTAWYCIDIVSKNSVLVTHGSLRLKQSLKQTFRHSVSQSVSLTIYVYLSHGPSSYNFLNTFLSGTTWHNNDKLQVTFLNPPLSSPTQKYINHNI